MLKKDRMEFFFSLLFLNAALILTEVSGLDERVPLSRLSQTDINKKIEMSKFGFDKMKTHEANIMGHVDITRGSPNHGVYISDAPEPEAVTKGRAGWMALTTSQMMVSHHCPVWDSRDVCKRNLAKYNLAQSSLKDICKNETKRCSHKDYQSAYRSVTGFCNHYGQEGESFTAYKRLLSPVYSDGMSSPRRADSKAVLPTARFISQKLTTFDNWKADENNHTLAVLQWGQFLEHDLSRAAVSPMFNFDVPFTCCDDIGFNQKPRFRHTFCDAISVPTTDPYYRRSIYCMHYARSLPAVRPDCTFGPAEQLNQATHYLDGSQIYGSSINKSNNIRDFSTGQLKMSEINNKNYLSLSSNPTKDCLYTSEDSICFMSADPRVNFEPQLTVMHTIWVREHNRLVKELAQLNRWTSNELYEEARRIVIAEMQHITYDEWLPEVLAKKYMIEIDKYTSYTDQISPVVLNSVGNAVLRAFKSMYPQTLKLFSEDRKEVDSLVLHKHMYKPEILSQPGVFDSLLRGLATQAGGNVDRQYSEDLINKLYHGENFGYDILALDIQRGRDHGLPPYSKYRNYLGFESSGSFQDFLDVMSADNVRDLERTYQHANDVDFIIGGLLERHVLNSLLGPSFSWFLTHQLSRTRRADRYFYTNTNQPLPFTPSQLSEIKKVTLARILCDNSDGVRKMQRNVFKVISNSNDLVSCESDDIPRMDLTAWKLS